MTNWPEQRTYRFDDVEVDLSRSCVVRGGVERHLRRKAFQVLVCLLEGRERLVTKDELFDAVWNDTAVTDDVLVQCIKEIRRSIGDDPQHPRFIKTVPRSGYRFIAPVQEDWSGSYTEEITQVEFEFDDVNEGQERSTRAEKPVIPVLSSNPFYRSRGRVLAVAAVALTSIFFALIYFGWRPPSRASEERLPQIEGKKSVAVMFFENQSGSPDIDWLREGLADMLVAGLSRSEKLTLLGRGQLHDLVERSGFGRGNLSAAQTTEIARQSQAEIFVTGRFAKIGESVRVDVQLHDSASGALLATETLTVERPERLLTEIDLLSLKISNRLNGSPNERQELGGVMTDNLEAYRFYSLGVEKSQALENKEAVEFLEKAVRLDPEFAMAHARIGYTYAVSWGRTETGKPYLEKAFRLSNRLTEKDRLNIAAWYSIANLDFPGAIAAYRQVVDQFPFETEAYWRLALLLSGEERQDEAVDIIRRGLIVDPNNKNLFNTLGGRLSEMGRHDEAIAAHERYVELAPNEPNAYDSLGLSLQWSGAYEKAAANFQHALELDPTFEIALVHLANGHVRQGQYRKALEYFLRYVEIAPSTGEKSRGYDCIAGIYIRLGDFAAARKYATKIETLQKEPNWRVYTVALRSGDSAKAKKLERAIFSDIVYNNRGARSNGRFSLYYKGMIALENGHGDEALELFRDAIAHRPPTWNEDAFEDCLGRAFLRLERFDEAAVEFERILKSFPNYPLAHYYLAEAYAGQGFLDRAASEYRSFLAKWKDADANIPEIGRSRAALGL